MSDRTLFLMIVMVLVGIGYPILGMILTLDPSKHLWRMLTLFFLSIILFLSSVFNDVAIIRKRAEFGNSTERETHRSNYQRRQDP